MLNRYLNRIGLKKLPSISLKGLQQLHQAHVFSIPFEDLDIQNKVPLKLNMDHLVEKVIERKRGGFCYELNYLFGLLLSEIGFEVRMISARVYDPNKVLGPKFDHLCLLVCLEGVRWLADVGFGDLFIHPIEVDKTGVQKDRFESFLIEPLGNDNYLLSMTNDDGEFEKKYEFNTTESMISDFEPQCSLKQVSPDSHFVKNKICTIATPTGRKTILNEKFIVRANGQKETLNITGSDQEIQLLKEHFGIIHLNSTP